MPGPDLRIDEVRLGYPCLCGLLQQRIINILHKSYFMKYNDAYKLLQESMHKENPIIRQIIDGIIKSYDRGIPILINRNPRVVGTLPVMVICILFNCWEAKLDRAC